MPKTNAEYHREHRQRQARRLAELEAENATLRTQLNSIRAELAALAESERLAATQCKHPSAAIDGGTYRACGQDVW